MPRPLHLDPRNQLLASIDAMIWQRIRRAQRRYGWSDQRAEEVVADILAHLAVKALPKWDPDGGRKWSTFAHAAISWKLAELTRPRRRQLEPVPIPELAARDTLHDRRIEELAALAQRDQKLARHIAAVTTPSKALAHRRRTQLVAANALKRRARAKLEKWASEQMQDV
jgi:hypothetical protein